MVQFRNASGVDVLNRYRYDFEETNPYSYLVLKNGTGKTSSPIYDVLDYCAKNNCVYNKSSAERVLKSRKYRNYKDKHHNLVCNLIDLEKGEGFPREVMKKVWFNLHACGKNLDKYQYVMLEIGEQIQSMSESDVYAAINRESPEDEEPENTNDEEPENTNDEDK